MKTMALYVSIVLAAGCSSQSNPNETFSGGASRQGKASQIIGKDCADKFDEMEPHERAFLDCADQGHYFHMTWKNNKRQWDCIDVKKLKPVACNVKSLMANAQKNMEAEKKAGLADDPQAVREQFDATEVLANKIGDDYMVNCWEGEHLIEDGTIRERVTVGQTFFPNEKVTSDKNKCAIFSHYIFGTLCLNYWVEPIGSGLALTTDKETVVDDSDTIQDQDEWNATAESSRAICAAPFQ